jgi:hypothetical protein
MSIREQEILISEILGPLSMHFKRGEAAYQNFHVDGRQFLFANILRDNNREIRSLILSKGATAKCDRSSRTFRYLAGTLGRPRRHKNSST